MGTKERISKVTQIRREDIIDAAERIFFVKSFDDTTMDDIAREAEYTKRTIYAYFKSKEELIEAVMYRAFRTLNVITSEKLNQSSGVSGLDKITIQGKAFVEFLLQYPDYFKAMEIYQTRKSNLSISEMGENACFREGEVGVELLMKSVREGISDGSIRNDLDPVVVTFTLWANITGVGSILLNKAEYLEEYHHKTVPDLLEEVFNFMILVLRPV